LRHGFCDHHRRNESGQSSRAKLIWNGVDCAFRGDLVCNSSWTSAGNAARLGRGRFDRVWSSFSRFLRQWNSAGCRLSRTQPGRGRVAVPPKVVLGKLAKNECTRITKQLTDSSCLSPLIPFSLAQPSPLAVAFAIASILADAVAVTDNCRDDATAATATTTTTTPTAAGSR
jgi:hypothetical protein